MKKCRQGIRGTSGQTTVAPIKAWPGSPAGHPQPLTARESKRIQQRGATPILVSSTHLLLLIHPVSYS